MIEFTRLVDEAGGVERYVNKVKLAQIDRSMYNVGKKDPVKHIFEGEIRQNSRSIDGGHVEKTLNPEIHVNSRIPEPPLISRIPVL